MKVLKLKFASNCFFCSTALVHFTGIGLTSNFAPELVAVLEDQVTTLPHYSCPLQLPWQQWKEGTQSFKTCHSRC